ncbi:MAG TPA: ABC transporter permease [Bryobacteraceae bacterium]|nr:ABC transporter permease [Bryobacteraceae bacterium]
MNPFAAQPVAIGLRLYRALAGAFPYEFRCIYGDELLLTTEDAIDEIWGRRGVWGLARLLLDIAVRVSVEHLSELWQDFRYGLRSLRASPGFTVVALLSLTLGIGVASSAFSEMNGFILRDVPAVSQPEDLVMMQDPVPYPSYQLYRQRSDLFQDSFAYLAPVPFGVLFGGHTERIWGHIATPSYFATLGVKPALGRFFSGGDPAAGLPSVVVSYRFWQIELGADPSVIGRTLPINGQSCSVIGVGPKEFLGASPMFYGADLWLPVSTDPQVAPELAGRLLERHGAAQFHVVARLRPGVSSDQAEAALDTMARQIEQSYGEEDKTLKGRHVHLLAAGKLMPTSKHDTRFFTGFFALLGGMILLIACSNVANMTLARAADRRKEIAVRLAIGAGRTRLVRQLLTESMMIAFAAGGLGFLMAIVLMRQASQMRMPYVMPVILRLEPDGRCLLFTFVLTVLTGLAFGLVPALRATRTDLTPALKGGGAVRFSRYRRLNVRNVLVVLQITASLTLLLITGFMVLGYHRMTNVNVGFDAKNVFLVSLDPVRDGYSGSQAAAVLDRVLDRMEHLPFVTAATLTNHAPMESLGYPAAVVSTAEPGNNGERTMHVARRFTVGRNYFETLGIGILAGRAFRKGDETKDRQPVILSETLAENLWPGQNPLGRRIDLGVDGPPSFGLGASTGMRGKAQEAQQFEVVGVARNVRDGLESIQRSAYPALYLPLRQADYAQPQWHGLSLMVRTQPGVDAMTAIRRELAAIDSRLTPFHARTMEEQIDGIMGMVTAASATYASIGIFGLILASVGLAGVTAYSVARRGREIGIRLALGARRADVLGLVMGEGAVLVVAGTACGMAGAWAGMQGLSGIMVEVARVAGYSTSDPTLLIGGPLLLGALAMAACYVPARKSMRIDPAVTLRQE